MFSLAPRFGSDFRYLPVGHVGQASQYVAQIAVRVQIAATAAFNDGVEDGTAITDGGVADEEPVLLTQRRGPNGVFHQIVVEFNAAVVEPNFECAPLTQGVNNGLAHQTLRQISPWSRFQRLAYRGDLSPEF